MLSGNGQTRGSYHHLSSKGEFDAPPRYNHIQDSSQVLNTENMNNGSPKKG